MNSHRRQAVVLVLVMGIVSAIAQLAGVGTTRPEERTSSAGKTIATLAGASVPDRTSTSLGVTSVKAGEGETVRMAGSATVTVRTLAKRKAAQVVCGIRYKRDGDASWSLGTPYETLILKKVGAHDTVSIERSFAAPASDTYRMSMTCHTSAPAKGAKVTAAGTIRAKLGLPAGAATPVE